MAKIGKPIREIDVKPINLPIPSPVEPMPAPALEPVPA